MHFKIQSAVFLAPNCQNEKTTRQINLVTEEMDLEALVTIPSEYNLVSCYLATMFSFLFNDMRYKYKRFRLNAYFICFLS